jgi:hypothetical protein
VRRQLLVHSVAIDLQRAGEPVYEGDGVLAASTGGIAVGDGSKVNRLGRHKHLQTIS